MRAQLCDEGQGCCLIEGDIDFVSVLALREQGEAFVEQAQDSCCFDFKHVGKANTAALSLLLCLKRKAQSRNIAITFRHLPAQLNAVMGLSDLAPLFDAS